MDEDKKDEAWWREKGLNDYYAINLPILIKNGSITAENIHEFIISYIGNDYDKLNKDINRHLALLSNITPDIAREKNIEFVRKFIKSNLIRQVELLDKIIKTENIQLEPKYFIPKVDNIFEILFVRHGLACSNTIPEDKRKETEIKYFDPELTTAGIERSKEVNPLLMKKIQEYFKEQPYSIIASSLMRTQETAYFSLAQQTNKPINVAPHIAERSLIMFNFSLSKNKQHKILNEINPEIVNFLDKGKDDRSSQDNLTKSYPQMFFDWSNKHLNFFEKGDDNIYRAVVFTHGGFIESIFKINAENNDIVHAIINSENALSLKLAYEHYRIKPMTDDIKYKCPNGCKISFCP